MIEITCSCGAAIDVPESEVNRRRACPQCRLAITPVAAERLAQGAGAGDFDARLVILRGPEHNAEQIPLGGIPDITIGRSTDCHIALPGERVSRRHARLKRIDFGPSRWRLIEETGASGIKINNQTIADVELRHDDRIQIGEFLLNYRVDRSAAVAGTMSQRAQAPATPVVPAGPICPSCKRHLTPGATICTDCGIYIASGRPLVLSKGFDEESFALRADAWIRATSWIVPFGLFPVASEAFGTRKPTCTWVIFGLTILASLLFFLAVYPSERPGPQVMNLMHWMGEPQDRAVELRNIRDDIRGEIDQINRDYDLGLTAGQIETELNEQMEIVRRLLEKHKPQGVEFRWYQLLTSAFLHDPQSLRGFLFHLGGNMLFLLVFGLRVNELVGNVKMAILYPLLAVASGLANMSAHSGPLGSALGASGAVMGVAGMYFILFPIQNVRMALWFRGGPLTKFECLYKIFTMRGFWLLLAWILWNDVLPTALGIDDRIAHWAHLGGFAAGAVLALILLFTRQTNAHGGDLLSVALGRRAWVLVGAPRSRQIKTDLQVRAVSMNFPQ